MLDRLRRVPGMGTVLDVHQRVNELGGNFQASAVTLALFLSLFPLMLVGLAVVGFVSSGGDDLTADIIDALGVTGSARDTVVDAVRAAEDSKAATSVIGFLGLVWSGLGVVAAIQHVCNRAWQIEGRGIRDKLDELLWLGGSVVLVGGMLTLSALLNVVPGWLAPLNVLAGVALTILFFLFTFRVLTSRPLPLRTHLPGALAAGIGFHVLTVIGTTVLPGRVQSSSAVFGSIGVVLALLAWLVLFGKLLVYAVSLNVVLHERRCGTVHVEVEAPRFDGEVPVAANRSAIVVGATTEHRSGG